MNRHLIDIVIYRNIYFVELDQEPTLWSSDDPWLTMAIATAITGARWKGHGELDGDERQEIMNWLDDIQIPSRARNRIVEVRRRDRHTDFLVDNSVAFTISDFDMRGSPNWWHKALKAIFSSAHLDHPTGFVEVDTNTGKRQRLPEF